MAEIFQIIILTDQRLTFLISLVEYNTYSWILNFLTMSHGEIEQVSLKAIILNMMIMAENKKIWIM